MTRLARLKDKRTRRLWAVLLGGKMLGLLVVLGIMGGINWYIQSQAGAQTDTVVVLANGAAENKKLTRTDRHGVKKFQSALNSVTLELAKMIVRDGEGASRFVTLRLSGAQSFADADAAVRAVANSALVKTSWCGGDPNWGRIIDALGYSAARVVEEKVDIAYCLPGAGKLLYSLRGGQPTETSFADLCKIAAAPEFDLHIDLNLGKASAVLYSSDLTEEYVDFNKGDVSDPASLGG